MRRWRTYRVLVVLVGFSIAAALLEWMQTAESVDDARARAGHALMQRYPESPRHLYLRGL